MTKLKPCWVCGGKALLIRTVDGWTVICRNLTRTKLIRGETAYATSSAWNTRAKKGVKHAGRG